MNRLYYEFLFIFLTTRFHTRTGALVTLSNDNKTAQRNHPAQEFNNGVVLSAEPLRDNQLFEVKIDRKVKYAFMYGV